MTTALLQRKGFTLEAIDGLSEAELESFPTGRYLRCTIVKARSEPNLRHYYACLHALSKALGVGDRYLYDKLLRLECGLATPIQTITGQIKLVPDSIALDKLEETAFIEFKRKAWDAIQINFGIDPKTLEREGKAILGKNLSGGNSAG